MGKKHSPAITLKMARKMLQLKEEDYLTNIAIAERFGVGPGTVCNHIRRAKEERNKCQTLKLESTSLENT